MQPLTRGQFVIFGTQVVHKTCARSGHSTELERVRLAEADALRATRQALAQVAEAAILTRRAVRAAEDLRDHLIRAERERDAATRDRTAALKARNDAITERDTAMAELARIRAAAQDAVPDSTGNAEQDPVALRFSLLDLD